MFHMSPSIKMHLEKILTTYSPPKKNIHRVDELPGILLALKDLLGAQEVSF